MGHVVVDEHGNAVTTGYQVAVTAATASGVTTGLPESTDLTAFLTLEGLAKNLNSTAGSITEYFSAPDSTFDYLAKEGKRRTITVTDEAVRPVVRALIRSDNSLDSLFCIQDGGTWRPLRSHEVSSYIASHAGGHFTAKEFRTWNATVLMALLLANAAPAPTARDRKTAIIAGVRGVADWLGDTPTVARSSYIDPRVISRYESDGQLATIPRLPAVLPAAAEAEAAVAALLAADAIEPAATDGQRQ